MCLTGRRYDAQEALSIGLVNRVVEPAELADVAAGLAREIATLPDAMPGVAKQSFLAQQPRIFES
jgi:enoyl-CoA hydratase